jgi:hypothetical protein
VVSDAEILPVKARTLVVTATKEWWILPTDDRVGNAKRVSEVVRGMEGNGECRTVEARRMRHPRILQDPRLFAGAVEAWIEGRELPRESSRSCAAFYFEGGHRRRD